MSTVEGRWWSTDSSIKTSLAAAFEGGGAKGIAYAGALQAVLDQKCWFSAVAGASAGAITAALVAAGAHPDELAEQTQLALAALKDQFPPRRNEPPSDVQRPTKFEILARLRDPLRGTVGDTGDLRDWLGKELDVLAHRSDPEDRTFTNVTFRQLHDATDIELQVVAVDLMRKCHCVFNYTTTPDCGVADAVTASASIPFVFPPARGLRSSAPEYAYPIVDGGVWTNFPLFVFEDEAFRAFHNLPDIPTSVRIVGFLLDEHATGEAVAWGEPVHAFADPSKPLLPAELQLNPRAKDAQPQKPGRFGRLMARNSEELYDRMAADPTMCVGFPVTRFKRLMPLTLSSLQNLMQPIIAVLVLGGVVAGLIFATREGARLTTDLTSWREWVMWLLLIGVAASAAAGVLLTAIAIAANLIAHYPVRQMGFLIGRTYAAGSGAPYWVGRDGPEGQPVDSVIRIPVLPGLRTLSFSPLPDLVKDQVTEARIETSRRLAKVLAGDAKPPTG